MSNGPKKKQEETTFVTLDAQEFNQVCKRVNELLTSRAQKAWEKKCSRPSPKATENHIEASKDAFAFIHLMDLVEHMTNEIHELRLELAVMSDSDDDDSISVVRQTPKRTYLN